MFRRPSCLLNAWKRTARDTRDGKTIQSTKLLNRGFGWVPVATQGFLVWRIHENLHAYIQAFEPLFEIYA